MELYLQYTGMDQDSLKATYLDRAEGEVKLRLALEKIAELEGLKVTDEELEEEIKKLADENNLTVDDVKRRIYTEDLRTDMLVTKALDIVKELQLQPRLRKKHRQKLLLRKLHRQRLNKSSPD